jgi:hypothetical protein
VEQGDAVFANVAEDLFEVELDPRQPVILRAEDVRVA